MPTPTLQKLILADATARELRDIVLKARTPPRPGTWGRTGPRAMGMRVLFDEAVSTRSVLLFDEADALFGKRTEVRDSQDRHANVDTHYLLQRLESFPGLVILTTNLRSTFDAAFLRRLTSIVEFPLPGTAERNDRRNP